MESCLYPLLLRPVYKDYIWGGTRIGTVYGREIPRGTCAESWEVADRPEGMSIVRNGPLAGASLHELVARMGGTLVGSAATADVFPLLIKIIDARERLSLQVHPDDESAARYGGEAKTEAWFVLAADDAARVFAGVRPGVTGVDLAGAISAGKLEDLLVSAPARPGQAVLIRGGCLHAIAAGCLLLEVQQNSNTTYRVYDWGRVGVDGKPRELHIREALQVIDWNMPPPAPLSPRPLEHPSPNRAFAVVESEYFRITRFDLSKPENAVNDGRGFHVLFCLDGSVLVTGGARTIEAPPGTSVLLPAGLANYTIEPAQPGGAAVLRIALS